MSCWFQRYGAATDAEVRLVCFPHAGGVPNAYRGWPQHLPSGIELLAVCYPGRHDRFAEPPMDRMDVLADQLTEALLPHLDVPLAFFGHSTGAAVAYEAALRLDQRHGSWPTRLFLSGHAAPHRVRDSALHALETPQLLAELGRLGNSAVSQLENPMLLDVVLPSLRADFRLIETYRPAAPAKVRSPIVAYTGAEDADSAGEDVRAWSELTTAGFELRVFPGGHFYLEPRQAELLSHMVAHLRADLQLRTVLGNRAGGLAPGARRG